MSYYFKKNWIDLPYNPYDYFKYYLETLVVFEYATTAYEFLGYLEQNQVKVNGSTTALKIIANSKNTTNSIKRAIFFKIKFIAGENRVVANLEILEESLVTKEKCAELEKDIMRLFYFENDKGNAEYLKYRLYHKTRQYFEEGDIMLPTGERPMFCILDDLMVILIVKYAIEYYKQKNIETTRLEESLNELMKQSDLRKGIDHMSLFRIQYDPDNNRATLATYNDINDIPADRIDTIVGETQVVFLITDFFSKKIVNSIANDDLTKIIPTTKIIEDFSLENINKLKNETNAIAKILESVPTNDFAERTKLESLLLDQTKKINQIKQANIENVKETLDNFFRQACVKPKSRYEIIPYKGGFAPDGTPTQLSKELYELTFTKNFQDWFGSPDVLYMETDEGRTNYTTSKVVTKHFEPQVVWHGTSVMFSSFKFDRFPAMYFAENPEYSEYFTEGMNPSDDYPEGLILPFFLDIKRPLDLTPFHLQAITTKDFLDYLYVVAEVTPEESKINPAFLEAEGERFLVWQFLRNNPQMLVAIKQKKQFDGIIFYEDNPVIDEIQNPKGFSTKAFIIFDSNQAKIADIQRGDMLNGALKNFYFKKGGKI